MEYGVPVPSTDAAHKFEVLVWDSRAGRDALVRFGHPAYEDFTQHGDPRRRASYLARSAGIRDGAGQLTKDDPLSANYWSRRFLWASGEPYADAGPGRPSTRRPSAWRPSSSTR